MKFVKEPPTLNQLECNPFGGEGFQLQCALEIAKELIGKVKLHWIVATKAGGEISWDTPWLKDIMETKNNISTTRKTVITSTLTVTWKRSKSKALANIQKSLLGGRVYCKPEETGNKDTFLPSNILLLSPGHAVEECTHGKAHAVNSSKCAVVVWSARQAQETWSKEGNNKEGRDKEKSRIGNTTKWMLAQANGETNSSATKDEQSIVFVDHDEMAPYIITMGALGIVLFMLGITIPAVILGYHIRKKCK